MNAVANWFFMGGYGLYVWPAYGIAAFMFFANKALIKKQKIKVLQQVQNWFKQQK